MGHHWTWWKYISVIGGRACKMLKTISKNSEEELDCDMVVETERNACISILFLIYAAVFALCLLIPHAIAQII